MITESVRAVLAQEGSATFVTAGPEGPHLVATWQSYLTILDDQTIAFPAGGYRQTEANLKANPSLQMIIGSRLPSGALGFRLSGKAEIQTGTPVHAQLKERFPWCRGAVILRLEAVEKVLG